MNTDFRVGVTYAMAVMAGTLTERQFFDLWFPERRPKDLSAAQEAVSAFFRCSEEPPGPISGEPLAYAFGVDAEAIIAAFQREYHIDLTTEKLHWWRFTALLHGLIRHSFTERVQYRTCNPEEIKDKRIRERYRKLKQQYALAANGEPYRPPRTLEEYNELLIRQARGEV